MTGKHHGWQARWRVDLATCTATHDSGLVVRFRQVEPGVWDGEGEFSEEWQRQASLRMKNPADLQAHAARLAREAGDVYQAELKRRQ